MGDAAVPAFKLTEAEAAQYSPIRFVSPGAAPSLIVHGDADTVVPIDRGGDDARGADEGGRARVVHSNRRRGARVRGRRSADLERANAAMVQWFEQHLGSAAK